MSSELLTSLLKEISRSFYLTMRVLPTAIRPQISLAYLLARISDTIADTGLISVEKRIEALAKFRSRILRASVAPLDFGELLGNQSTTSERVLLERCEEALALLSQCAEGDQERIRSVLEIIIGGQELDLRRFSVANINNIVALKTDAELDDYTFRVAGCVGQFWTRICVAHQFKRSQEKLISAMPTLEDLGVRFGKGLQLVNILRDLPLDLRQGRCYLPENGLGKLNLSPGDLLKPEKELQFRPLYEHYLDLAEAHLAAGWEYTQRIPWGEIRVRLACAWPILIGQGTIQKLRQELILDPSRRVKVNRREVRNLILKSLALYPFSTAWNSQFKGADGRQECC